MSSLLNMLHHVGEVAPVKKSKEEGEGQNCKDDNVMPVSSIPAGKTSTVARPRITSPRDDANLSALVLCTLHNRQLFCCLGRIIIIVVPAPGTGRQHNCEFGARDQQWVA